MYLHLEKSVYLSFFRDTAVFLDVKKDEFKIFVGSQYCFLKDFFNSGARSLEHVFHEKNHKISIVKHLIDLGLIEKESHEKPYPYVVDIKNNSKGTDNNFFRLPLDSLNGKSKYPVVEMLQCLRVLIKVHNVSKKMRFQGIIDLLREEKSKRDKYFYPDQKFLKRLERSLNLACLFFTIIPTRLGFGVSSCSAKI